MPSNKKRKAAAQTRVRSGRPKAAGSTKTAAARAAKTAVRKTAGKATGKAAARTKAAPKRAANAKKTANAGKKKPASRTTGPRGVGRGSARKTAGRGSPKAKKAAAAKTASRKAATKRATRSTPAAARGRAARAQDVPPQAVPGLSEEDQIRSAKYLPRDLPKPPFEEEQFLFPESYGVNRVRLLVRDPEWIFAYWDVSPETMKGLSRSLGERALALSRLTLRVLDPVSGGMSDILLPPGARWWYIRTDSARRTYRAEIGITLPSGEFRCLAESNSVVTPRVGPSRERARRRLSYRSAGEMAPDQAAAAGQADREAGLANEPWVSTDQVAGERGGASDTFRPAGGGRARRPGASDTFRPGASDAHRR
jgi:hypothetical protein